MSNYEYDADGNIVVPNPSSRKDDEPIVFDGDVYEPVTRAVGTQQEVGNRWADGELPVHEVQRTGRAQLRTTTGNYKGYQYPDGHGYTKHYGVTNAIRSRHGVFVLNPNDYARGWATLTYPDRGRTGNREWLPIDQIDALSRNGVPSVYDIFDVVKGNRPDPDGYDTLVVFRGVGDDGNQYDYHYRAARDGFDEDALLTDNDVSGFLNYIKQDDDA